jgi:glycosyltransferase involved in cell wall biosynthesis
MKRADNNRSNTLKVPVVSVLMAVHNCVAYLRQAIDSILTQTLSNFELIIVDDASTDGTSEILHSYNDPRIIITRNNCRLALPASLNKGLKAAISPLIARADGDDIYQPERLAKQVRYILENNDVGVVSSAYHEVDEQGKIIRLVKLPLDDSHIKFQLLWESSICHSSSVYRRETVLRVGGYNENFWTAQDYDLWARLSTITKFANLSEPLIKVRKHNRSVTGHLSTEGINMRDSISHRMLAKYLERELGAQEAGLLKQLLCGYTVMESKAVPLALHLLQEFLLKACQKENDITIRWTRKKISKSLMKHSEYLSYIDPLTSWNLFLKSLQFSPSSILARSTIIQAGRIKLLGRIRNKYHYGIG